MNFSCNRSQLSEIVSNASRAVSSKSTIPALEGVLITASIGKILVTGYDLELGITCEIPANVKTEGSIILNARLLGEILRKMDSENLNFVSGETLATLITGGKSEFSIMGIPSEEYPEIPSVPIDDSFKMDAQILKNCIDQTIFAIAQTEDKPIHTGSLFDLKDSILNIVSVDGYRMAMRTEKIKCDKEFNFVVPGKTLSDINKMISLDDEMIEISVGRKHVIFTFAGYNVITRLLEGTFIDYQKTVPTEYTTSGSIATRAFIDAIERTSLLITDRLRSPLVMNMSHDSIKMSCTTPVGRANDEIPCSLTGDEIKVGFNNKYLSDALKATGCDEVLIEINGPHAPMKIFPKEGNDFVFLVLPVRLKNDN